MAAGRRRKALTFAVVLCGIIAVRLFVGEWAVVPSPSMEPSIPVDSKIWINKTAYGARLPRRLADIPLVNVFTWVRAWRESDRNTDWGARRLFSWGTPERGDIVVFQREGEEKLLVKRIAALPGDTLQLRGGMLYVNGQKQPFPCNLHRLWGTPVSFPNGTHWTTHDYGPFYIPVPGEEVALSECNYGFIRSLAQQEGNEMSLSTDGQGDAPASYCIFERFYFVLGDNRDNSNDSRFWGLVPEREIVGKAVLFSIF